MEYKVIEYFTDLQDKDFAYNSGDIYPRKGYKPTEQRIEELTSDKNVRKHPIIKAVSEETETVAEVTAEETVEEKPKRKRKKRDK